MSVPSSLSKNFWSLGTRSSSFLGLVLFSFVLRSKVLYFANNSNNVTNTDYLLMLTFGQELMQLTSVLPTCLQCEIAAFFPFQSSNHLTGTLWHVQ